MDSFIILASVGNSIKSSFIKSFDVSVDVDVASVETASVDGSVEDIALVIKVVDRKKKVKGKQSPKRKTKMVFNNNRQKTKITNGSRKSKASRKTRTTEDTS